MPRYEYRYLKVYGYDKWSMNPERRRGGDKADRFWLGGDSALEDLVRFEDEWGDDRHAFQTRAEKAVMEYLNGLGSEGWRVVSCDSAGFSLSDSPPLGSYLLMRQLEE